MKKLVLTNIVLYTVILLDSITTVIGYFRNIPESNPLLLKLAELSYMHYIVFLPFFYMLLACVWLLIGIYFYSRLKTKLHYYYALTYAIVVSKLFVVINNILVIGL